MRSRTIRPRSALTAMLATAVTAGAGTVPGARRVRRRRHAAVADAGERRPPRGRGAHLPRRDRCGDHQRQHPRRPVRRLRLRRHPAADGRHPRDAVRLHPARRRPGGSLDGSPAGSGDVVPRRRGACDDRRQPPGDRTDGRGHHACRLHRRVQEHLRRRPATPGSTSSGCAPARPDTAPRRRTTSPTSSSTATPGPSPERRRVRPPRPRWSWATRSPAARPRSRRR